MGNEDDIVEPMTIDDLAMLMANGFAELKEDLRTEFREGLYGLEERLSGRITVVEHKIDAIRSDVSALFFNERKMTGRVEKLEEQTFGSIQAA